jgi:DNA-binding FadR family transcriptional regulator
MFMSIASRRPLTIHSQTVERLGRAIVSKEYPPGSLLPIQDDLSSELGVSRGALREAVKALVSKGMLETRPRLGTQVQPRISWNLLDPEVIVWHRDAAIRKFLSDLVGLRLMIEPNAAVLAARHASEESRRLILEAAERMAATATDHDEIGFVDADLAFHIEILRAGGNELVEHLGRTLSTGLKLSIAETAHMPGAMIAAVPAHATLARAIDAGDAAQAFSSSIEILEAASQDLAQLPDCLDGDRLATVAGRDERP